ncbi:virulence RhuM family protein [Corynebacterium amycolatum]|nr:virulence RhuM family protein [Corynebacterium amycolatum]MCQ9173710.1 virulence RhuM family protein [Corynebacterium amycolatum]
MAELFDVTSASISHHVQNITREKEVSGSFKQLLKVPGQSRSVNHYNLDMILAVGYRVRGPRGAQFRKWATEVLTEYLVKGFAMDDQRLKNDGVDTHFDELLERIREIRASERQFFRKICDVIAKTSDDYEEKKTYAEVRDFFAGIQNRLHFATHHHTAAELVFKRADHTKPNAGLTTWAAESPHKSDMTVAKNFLTSDELRRMNRLTSMFLDYAEDQAEQRKTILLNDWMTKADAWLVFNDRDVLQGKGDRSHKQAVNKANSEWDKYQRALDAKVNELDMKQLEQEVKELSRGEDPIN